MTDVQQPENIGIDSLEPEQELTRASRQGSDAAADAAAEGDAALIAEESAAGALQFESSEGLVSGAKPELEAARSLKAKV